MPRAGTSQATLTAKGRQTRAAIEQAARKLFAERGFHGTTLADITSAAGKSAAVFYRYFADKEDLLAALAESFLHDVVTPSGLSLHLPDSPDDDEFFTSVVTGYWNMFKQNIGIMIAVAQLATTQQRFAAVQNEFRRFGMDIVAASVRHAQEHGYATELNPEHTAAAIALLFENFTTVFVGPARARQAGTGDQRRGCDRDAVDDLEEDPVRHPRRPVMDFTLPEHLPGLLADMDAFIEREIAPLQADNMQYFDKRREHARTDWDNDGIPTREWEDLLSEMRRRADNGRLAAVRVARVARWAGRLQPRHGGHPGAPGAQGPWPAQRPAERVVDRRELPAGDHDGAVRHRRSTGRVVRGADHRRTLDGLRADRAAARLGRDLAGDARQVRR